jgi:glycine oxidase
MGKARFDVLIAGGGVIGLTIGLQLAEAGQSVGIFDQGNFGGESSWAGAGILSPPQCAPDSGPLDQLRCLSIQGLADFSLQLKEQTGIDNEYHVCGGLILPVEGETSNHWHNGWGKQGIRYEVRTFSNLHCPLVFPEILQNQSLYWLPDKAQIRNPVHLQALLRRLKDLPVFLHAEEKIEDWEKCSAHPRSFSAKTSKGSYLFNKAILCAGAWSRQLAKPLGLDLPVNPVKGQILLYKGVPGMLPGIIEQGKLYLVPRKDGRILCGSTEEHSGFDKTENQTSIELLHRWATSLVPGLKESAIEKTWCGLRPGSPDGAPFIGPLTENPHFIVATGHFRSGLQLSWGTAKIVKHMVLGLEPPINWKAFLPARPQGSLTSMFEN